MVGDIRVKRAAAIHCVMDRRVGNRFDIIVVQIFSIDGIDALRGDVELCEIAQRSLVFLRKLWKINHIRFDRANVTNIRNIHLL